MRMTKEAIPLRYVHIPSQLTMTYGTCLPDNVQLRVGGDQVLIIRCQEEASCLPDSLSGRGDALQMPSACAKDDRRKEITNCKEGNTIRKEIPSGQHLVP